MANATATFGFKHIGYLGGGAPDYQTSGQYLIQSTNTTKIGFGDPVMKANATSKYIIQATNVTTQPIIGIFQGCEFVDATGNPNRSPFWTGSANADAKAFVVDAPNALFLVACLATSVVTSNLGDVIGWTTGAPTTTGGGFAIATVDQSTATATSTGTTISGLHFRVVSLYQGVGNGSDFTTNFAWCVVGFNNQINRTLGGF